MVTGNISNYKWKDLHLVILLLVWFCVVPILNITNMKVSHFSKSPVLPISDIYPEENYLNVQIINFLYDFTASLNAYTFSTTFALNSIITYMYVRKWHHFNTRLQDYFHFKWKKIKIKLYEGLSNQGHRKRVYKHYSLLIIP